MWGYLDTRLLFVSRLWRRSLKDRLAWSQGVDFPVPALARTAGHYPWEASSALLLPPEYCLRRLHNHRYTSRSLTELSTQARSYEITSHGVNIFYHGERTQSFQRFILTAGRSTYTQPTMFSRRNILLNSLLASTFFISSTFADVKFSSPAAGATISGSTIDVEFTDGGQAPPITAFTSYILQLCAGGNGATDYVSYLYILLEVWKKRLIHERCTDSNCHVHHQG